MTPRRIALDVVQSIAQEHRVSVKGVLSHSRKRVLLPARKAAYRAIYDLYGGHLSKTARFFDRDHATIHQALFGRRS